jgi:lipoyl(octanoyl) transferase
MRNHGGGTSALTLGDMSATSPPSAIRASALFGRPWRMLCSPPLSAVENMALDEALLRRAVRTGEAVLRTYAWERPTLSLGRHQRGRGIFDAERAARAGVDIVRRLTGGRALLHHREVTYSVTAPVSDGTSLRESYAAINAVLLRALRSLGVEASLAPSGDRLPPPASAPCFERPAAGEILHAGRKLVGSAQLREHGGLLQHGSILCHDDQALVVQLASQPVGIPVPAATLADVLGREPSHLEVATALADALSGVAGPVERFVLDPATREDLATARTRYADAEWTWRR